jgi:carbon monoxide dehydrogenase subunit G
MIKAEHTVLVNVAIDTAWDYVHDIRKWASLMPGMQECSVIDADDSRWVIKVGVGALVRTVRVLVHVDRWDGPEQVHFSFKMEGDPVQGGGSFIASRKEALGTEVTLHVRVEGSGPVAPMWEAMSGPVLPQLAKSFAGKLKAEIETAAGVSAVVTAAPSVFARIGAWLRKFWRAIFRSETGR